MKTLKQTADDFQKLAECYKIQAIDINILLNYFKLEISRRMGEKGDYKGALLMLDAADEFLAELSEPKKELETA